MDGAYNEAFWFFLGVVSFWSISRLLNFGKTTLFAKETVFHCLGFLKFAHDDVKHVYDLKQEILKEADVESHTLSEKVDAKILENWRELSINKINISCPEILQKNIAPFKSWEEAMAYLKQKHGG